MACQVETKRLWLKPLGPEHIGKTYVDWLNNSNLMQFTQHAGKTHTIASCREYATSFDHVTCCLWAIEIKMGKHIGNINAYITQDQYVADIGLLLGPDEGGKGYGLEAWKGAMAALFDYYGMRKVTGGCLAPNQSMLSLMEKLKMVPDGVRKAHFLYNSKPVDVVHRAIFSENYLKSQDINLKHVNAPKW